MNDSLNAKLQSIRGELAKMGRVLVAFSGGVDSSLMLKLAHEALGDQALAALAVSPSLPGSERNEALHVAREIGAELVTIDTEEVSDASYAANAPNRCFHCKDHVYGALRHAANERGIKHVLDGMNAEDTLDLRPGRAAAVKHGVRSLLHEFGLAKKDVRMAAKTLGLSTWDKPQAACLSSRVPYGTPVTANLLQRIEAAEEFLKSLGIADLRVRHHGDVARVEVAAAVLDQAWKNRTCIVGGLKALGWLYVTLDLEGLRHGSMNEVLRRNDPSEQAAQVQVA